MEHEKQHKQVDEALQVYYRFLEIAYGQTDMASLLKEYVAEVKNYTCCTAVGIRILDHGGNIPYQANKGFSQSFFDSESPLSIKSDKCMCINVIKGDINPKLPFYTEGGSFYMNGTTRFLATVSEEEKGQTRNVCNEVGYESVALVPIRMKDHILGLIHVADPREDMVPLKTVKVLEKAGMQLGTAILRRWAEEMLRESEERFRQFFENEPDYCYMISSEGNILDVNKTALTVLRYEKEELVGKPVATIYTPESLPMVRKNFETWKKAGRLEETEMEIITKKGERRIVLLSADAMKDRNGKVLHSIYIQRDITERKRAEQALRESEEKYRILVETSPDAITLFDLNLNIIMVNRPAVTLYGYERSEEVIGKSVLDYLVPEQLARVREDIEKVLETGSIGTIEYTLRKKDGTLFPAELKASLILDKKKKPGAILCVSRDITERKQAEEVLRSEQEKLEMVTQNIGAGLALISKDYHTLWANSVLKQIFGDVESRNCYSTYNQREEICSGCGVREVFEEGREKVTHEQVGRDNQGNTIWSEIIATPIKDKDGNITAALELVIPITERKQAEEALKKNHEQLIKKNKEIH